MENDKKKLTSQSNNQNTSPTDIKGKDVHEANQTNSGTGGSQIKEGSNLLPEEAKKVPNQNEKEQKEIRKNE